VEEVAADLVGLHSSDPAAVYLAARARVADFRREGLDAALYESRSLVRMHGMRRTLFVVPIDIAATMDASCAQALVPPERRRLVRMLEEQDLATNASAWLSNIEAQVIDALRDRGEATAAELTADVPELSMKITFGEGTKWGGQVGVSTRVFFLLATEGRIVRARPRGTWLSSQYRWAISSEWIAGGLEPIPEDAAAENLIRRWLRSYGPGTLNDAKWWTGWTVAKTRSTLAAVQAEEVDLEGSVGYVLPGDVDSITERRSWVAMLPGLDPTVMGWKQRSWYLGEHQAPLFDRNGNAGPTVWVDGRIVGGWAQRSNGEVVFTILEDVGHEHRTAIEAEADRLRTWLGDFRVTPRFRAPLERELTA
jgi:hypothetical protein